MKISLNWLNDFIEINEDPEQIAEWLTNTGLEVEGIETIGSPETDLSQLVVGHVTSCNSHPNADRLKITQVDIGQPENLQIVCGAPNVQSGQKVIVAPVGTTLVTHTGDSFKIKKAKIRGEVSVGMICAEDEIGVSSDHDGIKILPETATAGDPVLPYLNLETDTCIEIGLTPNRGDACSHIGVARDLKALTNRPISTPEIAGNPHNYNAPTTKVEIDDTKGCPRYSSIELENVQVGESPEWLKKRLLAIGSNPINNVVDVTNYVLHEMGQPIHAFDADEIGGNQIIVRRAKVKESIVTLDGKERNLHSEDLVIADANKPLAIAGVFGGEHSGVTSNTKRVFIESAYFDPSSVRRTAKRHDLQTDASYRYERGTDPLITVKAALRVAFLLTEVAGAKITSSVSDVYPEEIKPKVVNLNLSKLNRHLGHRFDQSQVESILNSLDIETRLLKEDVLECTIPPYRSEVTREVDLHEEVLRIYGFNRIPIKDEVTLSANNVTSHSNVETRKKVRKILTGMGFNEISTNSLTYETEGMADSVKMLNPLSAEMSVLRTDLQRNLAETVAYNLNRKNDNLLLFELGREYHKTESGYKEKEVLVLSTTGVVFGNDRSQSPQQADYFYLKGCVNQVVNFFNSSSEQVEFGYLNDWSKDLKSKPPIPFAKIDLKKLAKSSKKAFQLEPVPVFPVVKRDLSVVLESAVPFSDLQLHIEKSVGKKLKDLTLASVYTGKPLKENQKSYAVSLFLYDPKKTMSEKEIDQLMSKTIRSIESNLNGLIRK
jgi:phenylalanyl-tRNA synthetase beta chain